MGKNGLHEGRSNSNESLTGCSQSRSDLRSWKNANNGPPRGWTGSLDELPSSKNLDDSDQFILGRDFVRNFDMMIDLNNGLMRIRNPDWKYVKKTINRILTDDTWYQFF